eukprot:TRINITY_DN10639_c0_g1_i2.p1 TRINITY_DN10639_c0_g1~~TRINITY_DN10639_c0_g1_i2.p1  ORF type:complete len:216 (+),score=10.27 TRINITY_DN10639_c0_g1_i2:161-808(+)
MFSTPHPIDLTPQIRNGTRQHHIVHFSAAFPTSGYAQVLLVDLRTVETMLSSLPSGNLRTMQHRGITTDDDGLLMGDQIVSLRCPLGANRIRVPAKGIHCKHLQCFDAQNYLDFCQQQTLWQCPTCSAQLPFHELMIDDYFAHILEALPHEMKVTISPNGSFEVPGSLHPAIIVSKSLSQQSHVPSEFEEVDHGNEQQFSSAGGTGQADDPFVLD